MNNKFYHLSLLVSVLLVLIWSGINPYDRFTWLLEVLPALLGTVILAATYGKFKFTTFCYLLIAVHMAILMVGGHYTYARVPLFDWLKEVFDFSRNHYDRIGHFTQGFVPAMVVREMLLRLTPLKPGKMLSFIVISICLAISASYELIEWWVALATGTAAEAFLGTQGDVWDTQWDMFLALCGAATSLLIFSGLHNRKLNAI